MTAGAKILLLFELSKLLSIFKYFFSIFYLIRSAAFKSLMSSFTPFIAIHSNMIATKGRKLLLKELEAEKKMNEAIAKKVADKKAAAAAAEAEAKAAEEAPAEEAPAEA